MRTIDADDFGNRMYHEVFEKDTDMQKWDSGCWVRYKLFENVLREQPTIEPQRKKGKWIDRGWSGDGRGNSWHEWECSECKHITKGAKWDFCPNCGADMREDGKKA